jgi:glycerophosphoryl diester phosphodiesterase
MASTERQAVFAIAHRGASGVFPENTVASFEEGIRLGARGVEFDLRMTADGVPVVLHDKTLERTTTGRGLLIEHTWLDLLQLDAGSWKDKRFAGTRIPSLSEALMAIGPRARPVIELKEMIPAHLLIDALRKYDLENEAIVISFDPARLIPIRAASKSVPIGLLSDKWDDDLVSRAKGLDAEALLLHTPIMGTSQVASAESEGLEVWCWTPNDAGQIAACAAMGAVGIITDYPDLIRAR